MQYCSGVLFYYCAEHKRDIALVQREKYLAIAFVQGKKYRADNGFSG